MRNRTPGRAPAFPTGRVACGGRNSGRTDLVRLLGDVREFDGAACLLPRYLGPYPRYIRE